MRMALVFNFIKAKILNSKTSICFWQEKYRYLVPWYSTKNVLGQVDDENKLVSN